MRTTVTAVNYGINITEYAGGIRFGTDSLLLSAFCRKHGRCADLGAGSGIIGLMLLAAKKAPFVTGIELVPEYASLANANAAANGMESSYECIRADVNDVRSLLPAGEYGLCVCNPPYLPAGTGIENKAGLKHAAFHETTADIGGFCAAAAYLLKFGGSFCCVYRPEYLTRLTAAMESNSLSLKRLRFVHPDLASPPSLILAEARKGGRPGVRVMPPLIVYSGPEHTSYTPEMRGVIEL